MSRPTAADRQRVATAKADFKASLDKHASKLQPGEVGFEVANFASWIKRCDTGAQMAVEIVRDFARNTVRNIAPSPYDSPRCVYVQRRARHYEIRKHFLDYAEAALSRRFEVTAGQKGSVTSTSNDAGRGASAP